MAVMFAAIRHHDHNVSLALLLLLQLLKELLPHCRIILALNSRFLPKEEVIVLRLCSAVLGHSASEPCADSLCFHPLQVVQLVVVILNQAVTFFCEPVIHD